MTARTGSSRRAGAGYVIVRIALAAWGWFLAAVAIGGSAFHGRWQSESPRPRDAWDILVNASLLAMALLLVLPFPCLARHTIVRRVLAFTTTLLLGRIAFGAWENGLDVRDALMLSLFVAPPMLALLLIHCERRRQHVDYPAVFD